MRDRLIELLKKAPLCNKDFDLQYSDGTIEKIADYLLENGAIVPPCKVGDVVYLVGRNDDKPIGTIDELVIVGIEKTEHGFNAKAKFKDSENVFKILDFSIDNYGFFSSRKEAEKTLAEEPRERRKQ